MLFAVFALVSAVAAQTTTSNQSIPSGLGITPCIISCVQPAASANGCSFTDPQCVCASAQFQADATECLTQSCTPQEVQAAIALQQSQCGNLSPGNTGTPGPRPAGTTTSAATTTPTTPSGSSTSDPAAVNTNNAAVGSVVGGTWAVAAGLLGVAVAL